MNTMNMPGFVAEAALYPTKARYHLVSNYGASVAGGQVFPQARKICVAFQIRYVVIPYPGGEAEVPFGRLPVIHVAPNQTSGELSG